MKRYVGLVLCCLCLCLLMQPVFAEETPPWESLLQETQALKDSERYSEAQHPLEKALLLVQSQAPRSAAHTQILFELATLEEVYLNAPESALARYTQILDNLKNNDTPEDDAEQVGYLQLMGDLYWQLERIDEGFQCHEKALVLEETALGADHHFVGNDQKRLAYYYLKYGRSEQAEALLKKMVDIRATYDGEKKIAGVGPHLDLARLYREQGKADKAQTHYKEALHLITLAETFYPESIYTQMVRDLRAVAEEEMKMLP